MNILYRNFMYMSQIIGTGVVDHATGKKAGKVFDLVANMKDMYPKLTAVVIRRPFWGAKITVPLKCLKKAEDEKIFSLDLSGENAARDTALGDNEILLRETFWDQQIVDVSGSKVVRVNDLHLLREEPNLWVVHVDIGFKGLVRRLGWSAWFEPAVKWLFSYELKDRFISWKHVQPISADKGGSQLSLKGPKTKLTELHPADLADILIDLGTDERLAVLKTLDTETAANTLKELPLKMRVQTAELIDLPKLSGIMNDMPVDEAVDLIAHFPKKRINAVLSLLSRERAKMIRGLMEMSARAAGSIMDVEFITVRQTATAAQAIENIKAESKGKETIYYIYAVDEADALVGVVTLRQLLTAPPEKSVSEIMRKRVAKVRADTDIRDVAQVFYKYDFTVVPVVDRQNKMHGIITIKDAFEAVFPEMKEEIER